MPELERPDGARIHYEVKGDGGPAIVLASYWGWNPQVYEDLLGDLATDHLVVTYHQRGTGSSSHSGPYDMETDIGDLEAVVEVVGGPVLLIGTANSANTATKLAARRADLVGAAVTFGAGPFARASFEGQEGMLGSDTVVGAMLEMLERNYRGGMRTITEATNPQMNMEELKQRVDAQAEFCPPEAALGRLRAWVEDDPIEEANAIGERLWVFRATDVAGPWLPPRKELDRLIAQTLPRAKVVEHESGPISAPHETAELIRQVSAHLHAGEASKRK